MNRLLVISSVALLLIFKAGAMEVQQRPGVALPEAAKPAMTQPQHQAEAVTKQQVQRPPALNKYSGQLKRALKRQKRSQQIGSPSAAGQRFPHTGKKNALQQQLQTGKNLHKMQTGQRPPLGRVHQPFGKVNKFHKQQLHQQEAGKLRAQHIGQRPFKLRPGKKPPHQRFGLQRGRPVHPVRPLLARRMPAHNYHAQRNPHGYHSQHNPHGYHPMLNAHGHHPRLNVHGHHPQHNPHGYHPQHNPHGYHPKMNPHGYHPQHNPHGYHPSHNKHGYHPRYNPHGYHPKHNKYGYHPAHNPTAYHPRHNPDGLKPEAQKVIEAKPAPHKNRRH